MRVRTQRNQRNRFHDFVLNFCLMCFKNRYFVKYKIFHIRLIYFLLFIMVQAFTAFVSVKFVARCSLKSQDSSMASSCQS